MPEYTSSALAMSGYPPQNELWYISIPQPFGPSLLVPSEAMARQWEEEMRQAVADLEEVARYLPLPE